MQRKLAPFGGLIGPGDRLMDKWLKHFRIFRLHAIFHDAFGFMRSNFGEEPGNVYTLSEKPIFANNRILATLRDWRFGFIKNCYRRKEYNRLMFQSLSLATSTDVSRTKISPHFS